MHNLFSFSVHTLGTNLERDSEARKKKLGTLKAQGMQSYICLFESKSHSVQLNLLPGMYRIAHLYLSNHLSELPLMDIFLIYFKMFIPLLSYLS